MSGHPAATTFNSAVGLALTVILNVWLVPRWGLLGAAVAQGVMLATVNLMGLVQVRWLLSLQPYTPKYRKPLLAAGAAGVTLYGVLELTAEAGNRALHSPLLSVISGGSLLAVVYVAGLLLQGLESEDQRLLASAAKRMVRMFD
jgi:O-antigen/teichoic acid export membrane protein